MNKKFTRITGLLLCLLLMLSVVGCKKTPVKEPVDSTNSSVSSEEGQIPSDDLGDVESVKAVADVFCPVSGEVLEINEDLLDDAALINNDPYGAWFIKVGNITDQVEFLTADEYDEFFIEKQLQT